MTPMDFVGIFLTAVIGILSISVLTFTVVSIKKTIQNIMKEIRDYKK
jgi:hypothetical protein